MSHLVNVFLEEGTNKFTINTENAGYDVAAVKDVVVPKRSRILVQVGVRTSFNSNLVAMICPRSGLSLKNGITVHNAPGIIDSAYSGEYGVILQNDTDEDFKIEKGVRVAQIVFVPIIHPTLNYVKTVDELGQSNRGSDGFGSTGTK